MNTFSLWTTCGASVQNRRQRRLTGESPLDARHGCSRAGSSSSWTEGTEDTSVKLRIGVRGYANNAPAVATAIPNQRAFVDTAFSYAFRAATFTDADGHTLAYSALQSDGTALPS